MDEVSEGVLMDSEAQWQEGRDAHEMALKIMDARLALFLAIYHDPRMGHLSPVSIAGVVRTLITELFGYGLTTDDDEEEGKE